MPVLVRNDWGYELAEGSVPDTVWNYINESLEVVDLDEGALFPTSSPSLTGWPP